MKFCGIDLHSNNSVVVVTDEGDQVLVSQRKGDRFIFPTLKWPSESGLE